MGSRALAKQHPKDLRPSKKARQSKAAHADRVKAAPTGTIEEDGDEVLSLGMLISKFGPLVGIVVIAAFITQQGNISSALGIGLLLVEAILAVFGVMAWINKPRT